MFKKRPDGTYLKNISAVAKIVPYVFPTRGISTIFSEQEIDITETLRFLRRFNKEEAEVKKTKVTFFMLYLLTCVRAIALRPRINRFTIGRRMWQRNSIRVSFVAKKELTDDGEEIWINNDFSPFDTLKTIGEKVVGSIREATRGEGNQSEDVNVLLMKFPRFIIRFIFWFLDKLDYGGNPPKFYLDSSPYHVSVNLTNVGSVGVEAPFHHLTEIGTSGLFISVGIVRKEWKLDNKGKPALRDLVKIIYTYDDRITDGIYAGRTIALIKKMVEDPQILLEPPLLTKSQLEELQLKDYPPTMANA